MSDRAINDLAPAMQAMAQKFLYQCSVDPALAGYKVFIDQTYRCEADQNAAYAKGRNAYGVVINKKQIITNAKYGESPHNCVDKDGNPAALAFDFAIETVDGKLDWNAGDPVWRRAIEIGTAMGLVSGASASFKAAHLVDSPHLELPHWRNT